MTRTFLRALAPRLALVLLAGLMFYTLEPGFHTPRTGTTPDMDLGPLGISATLANLSGLAMLILLAGFIAADRRRGYYRLVFSHPVHPLAYYGARWLLALLLAVLAAAVFLVVGQYAAWGEYRGGAAGLLLALLSAIAYGGLVAFLSAALPRGDAWVAVLIFLFTFFWLQIVSYGARPLPGPLTDVLTVLLPPQLPLQRVYDGLLRGTVDAAGALFSTGYGLFWLAAAALLVRLREWP